MTPRPAIKTHINPFAPREYQWFASYGEWDSGDPCGIGATEAQAIDDLRAWVGEEDDAIAKAEGKTP